MRHRATSFTHTKDGDSVVGCHIDCEKVEMIISKSDLCHVVSNLRHDEKFYPSHNLNSVLFRDNKVLAFGNYGAVGIEYNLLAELIIDILELEGEDKQAIIDLLKMRTGIEYNAG